MLITNGTIVQSGVRRRTIRRQVTFGPMSMRIVTLVIFAAAALIALAQSTTSATKAYDLNKYEQIAKEEQEKVDRHYAELSRLEALNEVAGQATPSASPSPEAQLIQSEQINYLPGEAPSSSLSFVSANTSL